MCADLDGDNVSQVGAGIQMTPNVAPPVTRWGISDVTRGNLVQCGQINMRRRDGKILQRPELVPKTVWEFGFPVDFNEMET